MSNYHTSTIPHVTQIDLSITNLNQSIEFYTRILGLSVHTQSPHHATLGSAQRVFLSLTQLGHASVKAHGQAGLYHFALLLPSRQALAQLFKHMVENGVHFQGASDHLISHALYLADPDGHGIELAADTDESRWPWVKGQLNIFGHNGPLDVQALYDQATDQPFTHIDPDTRFGHLHLHASHFEESKHFYTQLLNLDVVIELPNSALFLSNAHYHHHIALNRWNAAHKPAELGDAPALTRIHYHMLPNQIQELKQRLDQSAYAYQWVDDQLQLIDPNHLPYTIAPYENIEA